MSLWLPCGWLRFSAEPVTVTVTATCGALQDTSLTAEAQSHYQEAARAAQQHHQHIHQLLQAQASPAACQSTASSGRSRSSNSWLAVQTAAHHVLATYRAATLRLQQLTCLAEAREKLLHDIQQLQRQQDGFGSTSKQMSAASAARSSRFGCKSAQVLTAFELHLLRNPALLQQHKDALTQAVTMLQQQQECRQHATVFFAWATSAIAEAAQRQQSPGQQVPSAAAMQKAARSTLAVLPETQPVGQTAPSATQSPLPASSLQEMLLLVQQLPPADTQTAAGVLSRVYQQLQQAAAAAGLLQDTTAHIHTSTGSDHSTGAPIETATDPLARQLAGCRVDNSSSPAAPASQHQSTNPAVTSAYTQAAAAALVEAGVLPDACTPALQDVPADLLHTLQQLQDIHAQQQQRWQQQLAAVQQVLSCSRLQRRYQASTQQHQTRHQPGQGTERLAVISADDAASSMLGCGPRLSRQTQQQQQQQQHARSAAAHSDAAGIVGPGDVPAAAELQRLNGFALQVAKLLAKVRAANKQQLTAAAQLLLEAGDETGCQQLVLYQA